MCELTSKSKKTEAKAYKVVAKKKDKYYSFAAGFEYTSPMTFQKLTKQNSISPFWPPITEEWNNFFRPDMVGRTAAFKKIEGAQKLLRVISSPDLAGYTYCIVEVKLSNELMNGRFEVAYGCENVYSIYAGRTMTIIKEVACS